jgi:hypothetical protein|tara:strand:+ start:198 stop:434 length:237 start_codon:yes stop_codon:yes gene_type:complete
MFTDYSGMTQDKLTEKLLELRKKHVMAFQAGMSQDVVDQIQNMIDHLQIHMRSEAASDALRKAEEDGTDPDIDVLNIG